MGAIQQSGEAIAGNGYLEDFDESVTVFRRHDIVEIVASGGYRTINGSNYHEAVPANDPNKPLIVRGSLYGMVPFSSGGQVGPPDIRNWQTLKERCLAVDGHHWDGSPVAYHIPRSSIQKIRHLPEAVAEVKNDRKLNRIFKGLGNKALKPFAILRGNDSSRSRHEDVRSA